jgi:hypothetical protein
LSFRKDSESVDSTDDDDDSYEQNQEQQREQNAHGINLDAQHDQNTNSKLTNRKNSESASDLDDINTIDDQDWDTDIEEERE